MNIIDIHNYPSQVKIQAKIQNKFKLQENNNSRKMNTTIDDRNIHMNIIF